jgi:transposase
MLYLGIDLHRKQMTVSLRNQTGDVVLRRQVSTRPKKVEEFLEQLHQLGTNDGGSYVAILEVCGFHDWLVKRLEADCPCRDVVVVQPMKRSKKKTDRRDASQLSEVLWVNRDRLLGGGRAQGVRRIHIPSESEQEDRQLTQLRDGLVRKRTQTINQIRKILRRNNLEWELPTKTFQTQKVRRWLTTLVLSDTERLTMDQLLAQWDMWKEQIEAVDRRIDVRFEMNDDAQLLATIYGVSRFIGLAIACRIGPIDRFPRGRSLANFFGLTPGSRSSGERQRLGSITGEGSGLVRFLLAQVVVNVLRRDATMRAWYKKIKRRRGSKIARVAVMRRLAVIMWHMLTKHEAWRPGILARRGRPDPCDAAAELGTVDRDALLAPYLEAAAAKAVGKSTGSSSLLFRITEEVESCQG